MYETFYSQASVSGDAADLVKGAFAGQHDARRALFLQELHGSGVGYAHLRRDVKRHAMLLAHGDHAPVCDDKRVNERLCSRDKRIGFCRFVLENNGVESQVPFDGGASRPRRFASTLDFRKIGDGEVDSCALTHVEFAESEIHGIGTGVQCCLKACHVPGGGKYFHIIIKHSAHYIKSALADMWYNRMHGKKT